MSTREEVLAAAADLIGAFGRHDTAAYFAAFTPEATFCFYTHAERLGSREAYERLWARWETEDGFRVRACSSHRPQVQDLGEVAVFTHDVTTRVETHAGEEQVEERETIVFARQDDGRWLAVHEHLSPAATQ